MIRINLLPRAVRRKRKLNKRVILGAFLAFVVLIAMGLSWYDLRGQVISLRRQIDQTRADLVRHQDLVKKVDQFKADKQKLQDKLAVIDRLVTSQAGPVKLLDEISKLIPSEIWLTSINKSSSKVTIQGYSFTNFGVADFLTRLNQASSLFRDVDLSFSEKGAVEKVPVERFEITLTVKG